MIYQYLEVRVQMKLTDEVALVAGGNKVTRVPPSAGFETGCKTVGFACDIRDSSVRPISAAAFFGRKYRDLDVIA